MALLSRTVLAVATAAVGLIVLASLLTAYPWLDAIGGTLIDAAVIVAAFALLAGLVNLVRVHARQIRERRTHWFYSLVLLAVLLITLVAGLFPFAAGPAGPSQPLVRWLFDHIQVPVQASLSALLAFFVATAAYRLLRIRNWESAVMLVVALIVLAGQVTLGLEPVLPGLRDWILGVPAMAGVRGILLGVALGTIVTGIRLLLGIEHPYGEKRNRE